MTSRNKLFNKRNLSVFVVGFTLIMGLITPSTAITDGQEDGEDHPWVILIIMDVGGEPMYRCTGTLLSATVVLTAGHCTSNYPDDPYTGLRVFTESDIENGNNDYPVGGGANTIEAVEWAAHPEYETAAFYFHDIGIVILEEPGLVLDTYGELPDVDGLDILQQKRGSHVTTFTSVGYGLQQVMPTMISEKIRMVAYPFLIAINAPGVVGDFAMLLSNNPNTGGTCFGDSGGPNFLGDSNVIAGVTSFGMNGNCVGIGGVFRVDRGNVQDFIIPYLEG
ncbi:MAG: trypsin-like serine protease [Candidatus Heimdallarchaeota archaeon]|nr:trypsin-like serine protease [Candidatus Heimdallarchaeota archaeon]